EIRQNLSHRATRKSNGRGKPSCLDRQNGKLIQGGIFPHQLCRTLMKKKSREKNLSPRSIQTGSVNWSRGGFPATSTFSTIPLWNEQSPLSQNIRSGNTNS